MLSIPVVIESLLEKPAQIKKRIPRIYSLLDQVERKELFRELMERQEKQPDLADLKNILDASIAQYSKNFRQEMPAVWENRFTEHALQRTIFLTHELIDRLSTWERLNSVPALEPLSAIKIYHQFYQNAQDTAKTLEQQIQVMDNDTKINFFIECAYLEYIHLGYGDQHRNDVDQTHDTWNDLLFRLAQKYFIVSDKMLSDSRFDQEVERNPLYQAIESTSSDSSWCVLLMSRLMYHLEKKELRHVQKMFRTVNELPNVAEFQELRSEDQMEVLLLSDLDPMDACQYIVEQQQIDLYINKILEEQNKKYGYNQAKALAAAQAVVKNIEMCNHLEHADFQLKSQLFEMLLRYDKQSKNFLDLPERIKKDIALVGLFSHIPNEPLVRMPIPIMRALSNVYTACSRLLVEEPTLNKQRHTWCAIVASIINVEPEMIEHALHTHISMFENEDFHIFYDTVRQLQNQSSININPPITESLEWIP